MRRTFWLIACAALATAACGGSGDDGVTVAAQAETVTVTETEAETETVTETISVTETVKPKPKPKPKPPARVLFEASGNGSRDLAPFTIRREATLHWTAEGGYFFVTDNDFDEPNINLSSDASRGRTYVAPGRYQLSIGAVGDWTITIR